MRIQGKGIGITAAVFATTLAFQVPLPAVAQGQDITFTKIVDTDSLVPPENTETFFSFFPPSIDGMNLAFLGSNDSQESGIYRWIAGELIEIADRATPLPTKGGPPSVIRGFGALPSMDGETVMLVASDRQGGRSGVYTGDGGPLKVVVDPNTPLPGGIGNFNNLWGIPGRDDGKTFFIASANPFVDFGLYRADPEHNFKVVADLNTIVPGGTIPFGCPVSFCNGPLAMEGISTDKGNVAFNGGGVSGDIQQGGIFKWVDLDGDGKRELVLVANFDTPVPEKPFTFGGFGVSSNFRIAIGGNDTAFVGTRRTPRFFGIVSDINGVLELVVEEGDPTPDGLSIFLGFNIVSIDNGNVAFNTIREPLTGIYVKPAGGDIIKVIDSDDLLDGKAIDFFRFGHESISGNKIAFGVDFIDGSRGIYIAEVPVLNREPVTLTTAGDSFLDGIFRNKNEGANPRLFLRAFFRNRPVVAFDPAAIDAFVETNGLSAATLVLNVAENRGRWGDAGRTVDALPLSVEFAEGNGKIAGLPLSEWRRGNGPGVTWNCPSDDDIGNFRSDCPDRWNGGVLSSATAAPVLHTDDLSGEVRWDVTEDVLAGTSAWLVRKSEEFKTGQVRYHSKESAEDLDAPHLAPRLVLTP